MQKERSNEFVTLSAIECSTGLDGAVYLEMVHIKPGLQVEKGERVSCPGSKSQFIQLIIQN